MGFLLCLLVLAGPVCGRADLPGGGPKAVKGMIDLGDRDFERKGVVRLDGEWELYFGRLIPPEEFIAGKVRPSSYITIPSIWNDRTVDGRPLPGTGCATCRIVVRMKKPSELMGLKLLDAATAYTIYCGTEKVAGNGVVSDDPSIGRPQYLPQTVPFAAEGKNVLSSAAGFVEFQVVAHISNYHHRKGGMWESVRLGTFEQVRESRERNITVLFIILGAIAIMAFYHIGLYYLRRSEISALYFALFSLFMTIRSLVMGERMLQHWFPSMPWELLNKLEYITSYCNITFIMLFVFSLYRQDYSKRLFLFMAWMGAVLAAIVAVFPIAVYSRIKFVFDIYVMFGGLYILIMLAVSTARRREGAFIALTGMFVLYMTGLNDILYNSQVISTMNLAPTGLLFYIFSQSYLLSRRFSNAFSTVEDLSHELRDRNEDLLRMDRFKDEFLANTSHELRTPLNGIIGIADSLLEGSLGDLTPLQKKNVVMIGTSARRLSNLVNDILDFSKMKNGEISIRPVPVDLYTIVDYIMALSRHSVGARGIALVNGIEPGSAVVLADENRLQQIMQNLIGNAVKFTESGSVEVTAAQAQAPAGGDPQLVEIRVRDTGIGIPADKLEVIFESFQQADGSISREYGGTGLGLAITKKLVELHGGTIRCDSAPGRGTTFIITLPATEEAPAVEGRFIPGIITDDHAASGGALSVTAGEPAAGRETDPDERNRGFSILIVDDDPVNLQVLYNHLFPHGYEITTAYGGVEALELINGGKRFDLIILDLMMPRVSGYHVCRTVREHYGPGELPIIILTAKMMMSDLEIGLDAGANDYMLKPFDKRELMARVKTMQRLREAYLEHERLIVVDEEFNIAERVQRNVLTENEYLKGLGPYDIDVAYCPQNGKVGGDYYNVRMSENGVLSVTIADATGHGLQAALLTMQIDIINKQSLAFREPDRRLDYINGFVLNNLKGLNYFTCFTADIADGTISFASAGHPDQVLLRRTGGFERLKERGRLIGLTRDRQYTRHSVRARTGDMLVLFTDGAYEQFDAGGEVLGEEAFYMMLSDIYHRGGPGMTAAQLNGEIISRIQDLAPGDRMQDDITIVTIRMP